MRQKRACNPWHAAAAALSAATLAVHLFAGGQDVVEPLLSAHELPEIARFTLYYCWHLITITLAAKTLSFAVLATNRGGTALALLMTGLAGTFAAWDLAMIAMFGLSPIEYGQWILFTVITACSIAGLLHDHPRRHPHDATSSRAIA